MGNYFQKKEEVQESDTVPANLVLIGAVMSGKRTQAYLLQDAVKDMCHLKVGELKMKEVMSKTSIGKEIEKQVTETGDVSDDLVLGLIEKKMNSYECRGGFIMTDFPLKVSSAEGLDQLLEKNKQKLHKVINLKVNFYSLLARLDGCLDHPASGRRYHLDFLPPNKTNKDNVTGEKLLPCLADTEGELRIRNGVYFEQTKPVLEYYSAQGKVNSINGDKKIGEVHQAILSSIVRYKTNKTAKEFLDTLEILAKDVREKQNTEKQ
ncbi:uncharacterized protein LOC132729807 isoform X1 [Ruditapes philippinarum]|uniref:uncharacterized protein LOC132729807 isoform X1 n=1 Tax=Ruditapes philippinarum TaxID=129788 RepID=UPI00295B78C4|nr:uncharacterized protein LOC132729807 isoform X1 [Ruditapes philippinarum]